MLNHNITVEQIKEKAVDGMVHVDNLSMIAMSESKHDFEELQESLEDMALRNGLRLNTGVSEGGSPIIIEPY